MTKVFEATEDGTSERVSIEHRGEHIFAIDAAGGLNGGTLSMKVYDHATNTELFVSADEYVFTEVFTPFKVLLAPGMSVEWSLVDSTEPSLSVFMYHTEV